MSRLREERVEEFETIQTQGEGVLVKKVQDLQSEFNLNQLFDIIPICSLQ